MLQVIKRIAEMLGFTFSSNKPKDFLATDVSRAVQRNEAAGDKARRALEDLKQTDVMRELAGKM